MPFFYNLCSSSSGNASFVGEKSGGVLFDAGIGIRNFSKFLGFAGLTPTMVEAIFITHEHSDHISGLEIISSKYQIPVYGSAATLDSLLETGRLSGKQPLHIIESPIEAAGMLISPFPTAHDSPGSLGYRVDLAVGVSVGICTDLGHVSDIVKVALTGCDFAMLESNYDESMLKLGSYPYFLKKRIASKIGHLSNQQCAELMEYLIGTGCKEFALAHLSEENNHPMIAAAHARNYLATMGMEEEADYRMTVLPKRNEGRVVALSC